MTLKCSVVVATELFFVCLAGAPGIAQNKPNPVNIDEVLREAVKPDRALAYRHYALAKLREKEGNVEAAEQEFRKALDYDPASSTLRSEAAEFFLNLRKVPDAISLCQEAIRLDNNNADAHYLLGNIYSYVEGQPGFSVTSEDAIRELEEVVRIDSTHYMALFRLAQLYLHKQKPQRAAELLEKFNSTTGGHEESYYFLALAYDALNRSDEAIKAAQIAVTLQPSTRALDLLGGVLSKVGRGKEAIDIFRKVLSEDSDNIEVQKRLAGALLANNDFEEAAALLEQITAKDAEDISSQLQLGKAYMGLRQFDKALEAFGATLKLDPTNVAARFYTAYVYEEKGESEKALAAFRKLLEDSYKPTGKYSPQEFDDRILFQRHIAFIYQDGGDMAKAIEEFRSILASQDRPENYRTLINALRRARKNSDALQASTEAIRKYPEDKYLAIGHCQLLAELQGWEKGERKAKELVTQYPNDLDYIISLSQIYIQAKRYNSAEEVLKKALESFSGNETLKFQLGAVYERAKDYDHAEEQFLDIIKQNPKNAGALNYLGYMWADRGLHLQDALKHIQRAVELEPNNGAYLDSLGWVYFKLDELQNAEKYLEEAIRRVSNDPTIHEHLGDLYYKRGLYVKAESAWQQAVMNGTEDEEIRKVKEKLNSIRKKQKRSR